MRGIHDMGGMQGFGRVAVEPAEPVFHARWETRVYGISRLLMGLQWMNVDAFRHGIERIDPVSYLTLGYYGRWLAAIERVLIERGLLAAGDVDARIAGHSVAASPVSTQPATRAGGVVREVARAASFRPGAAVRARLGYPAGHTRLPGYVAGRRGVIHKLQPACVYPDTNAHGQGENPQHLYSVCFEASELWGADAERDVVVYLDLFEPYLEPA